MNRLWVRLTAAFLLVTWIVLVVVAGVVYRSVESSFQQYVSDRDAAMLGSAVTGELEAYYATTGSWLGVEALLPTVGRGGQGERRGRGGMQSFIADPSGMIVAASDPATVGQTLAESAVTRTTPLQVDGVVVGMLGQQMPSAQMLGEAEQRFTAQVTQALGIIAVIATGIALGLGILLAYTLASPLQRLARRIGGLTASRLGEEVQVEGATEVRQLACAFNTLSHRLAETDRLRQQMTTDVAHELRTPVTVLRGHLEAMMDGIYALDTEHLAVAYDQTIHLARLVEDLRLLTQAEAGRLALVFTVADPATLVESAAARFAPLAQDAEIMIEQTAVAHLPPVQVDAGRIQQVFDNLLTNALRHTTAGGTIAIDTRRSAGGVQFSVANTGNLPPEQIAHIFDRFWRADEARQRDAGGSGLGLAITRQLVVLHRGTIRAEAQNGMTAFIVELPVVG